MRSWKPVLTRFAVLLAGGGAVAALTGCSVAEREADIVNGKTLFVQKCGACHTLKRANTKGVQGPNLDEAFQQARKDGLGESSFKGIVYAQILHPARDPQRDAQTGKPLLAMPAKLVQGSEADDVAAYVAEVVARGGEDAGVLASAGAQKSTKTVAAQNGTLDLPTDPSGALAYQASAATATAGPLKIVSKNDAAIGHNVAIEGGGLDEKGPVVTGGGTSEIDVSVKPGEYTLYCSVPGHREGGMELKLTVK